MAVGHNFRRGIDWDGDATGATPLPNRVFVSKSGNDGTGVVGDPTQPFLTINAACQAGTTSSHIIIGAGIYINDTISRAVASVTGDVSKASGGGVVMKNNSNFKTAIFNLNSYNPINNITFKGNGIDLNFLSAPSGLSEFLTFRNCRFVDTQATTAGGADRASVIRYENCEFINSVFDMNIKQSSGINTEWARDCKFFNSTYKYSFVLERCYFDSTSFLEKHVASNSGNSGPGSSTDNNNINCPITILGTPYADLAAQKAGVPDTNVNSIDADPKYVDPARFNFFVEADSPHIAANIATPRLGISFMQNSPSTPDALGVTAHLDPAVAADPNASYGGLGQLQVTGTSTVLTSLVFSFSKTRVLTDLDAVGFADFVNNVIDTDNGVLVSNPNFLDLEIRWAGEGEDINLAVYKRFKIGEPLYINAGGATTGESAFQWNDLTRLAVKQFQFRITLRNDYIPS